MITADTPFAQVKLGELGSWFARRNKSPRAMVGAISRGMIYSVQQFLPFILKVNDTFC